MKPEKRFWLIIIGEAGLFMIIMLVLWLDEFIDLPHLILGAEPTPNRLEEYFLETMLILITGFIIITITTLILKKIERLDRFLRVCAWCRKIRVDDKWVSFEEYALKQHSLKSSHGICEECMAKMDLKKKERTQDTDQA